MKAILLLIFCMSFLLGLAFLINKLLEFYDNKILKLKKFSDYDEFCKLPIFKKGYICMDSPNSIWFFSCKPRADRNGYWNTRTGKCFLIQEFFEIDTTGINPRESLRKVGGK